MAPQPFLLIPAQPSPPASGSGSGSGSASGSRSVSASGPASIPAKRVLSFQPPAHRHAVHIHSIPPSSTSTRALILERTLSQLTDCRLAAARAHLAYGAITHQSAPDSVRHQHEFHNNFTRSGSISLQDDRLAAKLDSDATGVSSVLCAMLAQDPPNRSPQQLPNDVRFRLALAILLEHYFAPPPLDPSSSPSSSSSSEKKPEIPLEVAPFVSLSSFRPSSPSTISRPSHPTLPSLKSLNLAATSPPSSNGPQSPFASFSASGVSTRPVKPPFFGAGPSGRLSAPNTPSPKQPMSSPSSHPPEKNSLPPAPVPVYKWPSQDRGFPPETAQRTQFTSDVLPKTMTKPTFMWSQPSSSTAEKEKIMTALWSEGVKLVSGSNIAPCCVRHLRRDCKVHPCPPSSRLPRTERSTIGAGLDSRRSRLDIFSDATENEVHRARMLNVLSEFIRFSALISSSLSSSAQPRKDWFDILALLLTRAVLEGYLLHQWHGTRALQVLFGFGGPISKSPSIRKDNVEPRDESDSESEGDEDDEAEFSPDNYPDLRDACSTLFANSSSMSASTLAALKDLKGFRDTMNERRQEFLSPSQPPPNGLESHLQSLNNKYSAEELDKKMVEFIERISEYKGAAALERSKSTPPTGEANNVKALDKYFQVPLSAETLPRMVVDAASEDSGLDDDGASQSEGGDSSADERTPTKLARATSPSASSKRPRATSVSDDVLPSPTSSHPPSKRERLGAPAS